MSYTRLDINISNDSARKLRALAAETPSKSVTAVIHNLIRDRHEPIQGDEKEGWGRTIDCACGWKDPAIYASDVGTARAWMQHVYDSTWGTDAGVIVDLLPPDGAW